ncbi:Mfa1 family fimbria major subunit [Prevotella copri]|uniref:Mfa1 family fimbria major subunit n=1 Tax=Segatella copri TaxID=165179 RepID=UPI001F450905|nr:Mfa1 family fimbria major subunit [Segatella copri]MCF2609470.1 Mfa1 family fimbria major subunit [Segatella copri]
MKKMNLLVMSLVSAAALSFTSCSSNDELDDNNAGQNKVDKFYMTLTVQTPTSNGTRTAQNNPREASKEESYVTSGTFYLVDANGKIAKSITIDEKAWADAKVPQQGTDGKTTLQVPVENVTAGTKYSVYFLANATSESPLTEVYTSDLDNKFAKAYATANKFAMFNENDADVKGDSHTVVFTSDNKDANSAAKVSDIIKIDRLTARIDEPTSEATEIKAYAKDAKATEAEKKANEDAIKAVKGVTLTRYAISNVANKTNVMQQWTDATTLSIPTGITYFQPTSEFGTKTLLQNYDYFNAVTTDKSNKDYVFENNSDDATSMYFEYTVELNKDYKTNADFEDGTFYRYNKVIYSRIQDIINDYKDQKAIFDGKDAAKVKAELEAAKEDTEDPEAKLDEFRKKYDIEVFNNGKTYYVQKIKDQYLNAENTIQRNSIYLLNVKNIFNVGAQVPNGGPDDRTLYYLDVEVSVNPWVLNSYDVDLK